jgi:hypothetical protein
MQSYLEQNFASHQKKNHITSLYGGNISFWVNGMQCDGVTFIIHKTMHLYPKNNVYHYLL